PQISDALLAVVARAAPNAWLRQCGRVGPLAQRLADRKGLVLDILSHRFRRRAAALGLRTNPAFAGTYEFDDPADFARLFPRLSCGRWSALPTACWPLAWVSFASPVSSSQYGSPSPPPRGGGSGISPFFPSMSSRPCSPAMAGPWGDRAPFVKPLVRAGKNR